MPLMSQHSSNFQEIVETRLGLLFAEKDYQTLEDVLENRLAVTREPDRDAYLSLLSSNTLQAQQELSIISTHLTITETFFFRHMEQLQAFAEVALPSRMARHPKNRTINILSAGCASGEEAYSLAILVQEVVPDDVHLNFAITGIDINESMLAKARAARFSSWSLRSTSEYRQTQYFSKSGADYVLANKPRSIVNFEKVNLVDDNSGFWKHGHFDIIFCRNVTIYFSPATTRSLIERFTRSLAPGGYLFLGSSETLRGVSKDFNLMQNGDAFFYQKKNEHESEKYKNIMESKAVPATQQRVPAFTLIDDLWSKAIAHSSKRVKELTIRQVDPSLAMRPEFLAQKCAPQMDQLLELMREENFAGALHVIETSAGAELSQTILLVKAAILTNQGRINQAEAVCAKLLEEDGLNAGAHYLLALCNVQRGQLVAAGERDEKAISIEPTFVMPHLHLGLLAKRIGDKTTACVRLKSAAKLLVDEDPKRIVLFGGGFSRESLTTLCRNELAKFGEAL